MFTLIIVLIINVNVIIMNLHTGEAGVHGRVREDGGGVEADIRGVRHQVQVRTLYRNIKVVQKVFQN